MPRFYHSKIRSKNNRLRHPHKQFRNNYTKKKERYQQKLFKKMYKQISEKWEDEIDYLDEFIEDVPPKLVIEAQVKVDVNPANFTKLASKFNELSTETFNSKMASRNPKKFISNCIKLWAIFSVLSNKFKSKSKGLGIPKKMNINTYL